MIRGRKFGLRERQSGSQLADPHLNIFRVNPEDLDQLRLSCLFDTSMAIDLVQIFVLSSSHKALWFNSLFPLKLTSSLSLPTSYPFLDFSLACYHSIIDECNSRSLKMQVTYQRKTEGRHGRRGGNGGGGEAEGRGSGEGRGGGGGGGEGDRDSEGGGDGRGDLMISIFNGYVVGPHHGRRDRVTPRWREGRQTMECGGRADDDVFYLEALKCFEKLLNCFLKSPSAYVYI